MAYTGNHPLENDDTADLLSELTRKKNRNVTRELLEKIAKECNDVLSGKAARHPVEVENVEALIQTYGTFEKVSARIGVEKDDQGYYIPKSKALAANRAVFLAWLLSQKNEYAVERKVLRKNQEFLIEEIPLNIGDSLIQSLDLALSDSSVVTEWNLSLGDDKQSMVQALRQKIFQKT